MLKQFVTSILSSLGFIMIFSDIMMIPTNSHWQFINITMLVCTLILYGKETPLKSINLCGKDVKSTL